MSSKVTFSAATDGVPTLMPKRRFPEFATMAGWDTVPGNELFQQINNRQAPPGLPILAITQEHGAIPRDLIDYHVSATEQSVETYKEVKPGDFIISLRSFQGGIEYSKYHGICSPAYVILRKRADISDKFFKQHFKSHSFIQQLTRNLEGLRDGKMISYTQFSELRLLRPSLPEQQKIADCMDSVDALIAAQGRKVAALKAYKKGLMQQLFPQEGETEPRLRFPEFEGTGEWEECDFPNVIFFQEGPGIMAVDFHDDGVPLVRLSGLGGQRVTLEGCNYLDPKKVTKKWEHFRLEVGDIVVSCSATFGRPAIVDGAAAGAVFYTGLIRFRPKNRRLDAGYLEVFLGSPNFSRQAEAAAVGGGIRHFGPTHLREMKAPLPPSVQEQQRIADCLTSLDDLIAADTQKLDRLKTHKKGLMQQLFPRVGEDDA